MIITTTFLLARYCAFNACDTCVPKSVSFVKCLNVGGDGPYIYATHNKKSISNGFKPTANKSANRLLSPHNHFLINNFNPLPRTVKSTKSNTNANLTTIPTFSTSIFLNCQP